MSRDTCERCPATSHWCPRGDLNSCPQLSTQMHHGALTCSFASQWRRRDDPDLHPDTPECAVGSITRSITRRSLADPTPDQSTTVVRACHPTQTTRYRLGGEVARAAAGSPGCDQLVVVGTHGYRLPVEELCSPSTASSTATPRTANRGRRGINTRRPSRTTGSSPFSMARVTVRTSTPNTEAACATVTTAEPLALRSSRFTVIPLDRR
jgi:hypothetical protein